MDWTSIAGLAIALGALLLGQALEGGHLGALFQLTAGVIVIGGTFGATMLSVPAGDLRRALSMLARVFSAESSDRHGLVEHFARLATLARKEGLIALEARIPQLPDPFLRRAVQHVVDGTPEQPLREILETDLDIRLEEGLAAARVFDTAAGYAPTIGILGAVFGLIRAMETLAEPSRLGVGIAIAFVATIYGVGLANLVLLPIATKLQRRIALRRVAEEMIVEGAIGLQVGHAPSTIRARLLAFLQHDADGSDRR